MQKKSARLQPHFVLHPSPAIPHLSRVSYQVIARKYRPQRFSDVVGQEHVTQTLANAIAAHRIAHAYLFCGPRGTGKTTVARIFAKCLNCTGGPKADFPDDDPRCQEIVEGRALDVIEIDGASNNGIEQIRDLREAAKFSPATSKFKIYIIDEVHMLTTAAFNALLKTLEEPPAHVKFLFATTDPQKVLPTILSRCQRFDLRRIPATLIVSHLKHIAAQESVEIDDAALQAVARGADGGMRDAESTLDQLISFCGNRIEEADVLSMFGLTAQTQIIAITQAILDGQPEPALRELNNLARGGKDLGRLLADLLTHFRNLLIYVVSQGDLRMLEISENEAARLAEQANGVNLDALTRILEVLTDCEGGFRDAASKKILIEVALLKAIRARHAVPIEAVLKQLQQLRGGGAAPAGAPLAAVAGTNPAPSFAPTPAAAAPAPRTAPSTSLSAAFAHANAAESAAATVSYAKPAAAPAPAPAPARTEAAAPTPADLGTLWPALMAAVERANKFTHSTLKTAHPVSLTPKLLTIGFDPEFETQMHLADNSKTHGLLQTKLHELGQPHVLVKFVVAEAPAGFQRPAPPAPEPVAAPQPPSATAAFGAKKSEPPAASAKPGAPAAAAAPAAPAKPRTESVSFSQDDFKNDPLIQKALEVFKGTIVDVRA